MLQMKPSHSHPHHAEADAWIIEYLVIQFIYKTVTTFSRKSRKATIFEKKIPMLNFKY